MWMLRHVWNQCGPAWVMAAGLLVGTGNARAQDRQDVVWMAGGSLGYVSALAYAPDGRLLASADRNGSIKLWRTSDDRLIRTLVADHADEVNALVFSPDGQMLAAASAWSGYVVSLWRASDGALLRVLEGHRGSVLCTGISPDGTLVVSGSADDTFKVWRAADGSLLQTIDGRQAAVRSVAFSPDGASLATGYDDGRIDVWNVGDWDRRLEVAGHADVVTEVRFSPDGTVLLSSGGDGAIKVWSADNGAPLLTFGEGHGPVQSLAVSSDGNTLASCGSRVRLWRVKDGELLRTLEGPGQTHFAVAFAPDDETVAAGGTDRSVMLWRTDNGEVAGKLGAITSPVAEVAWSPDGSTVAACTGWQSHEVGLWNAADGDLLHTLPAAGNSISFSPDSQALFTGERIWRVSDGQLITRVEAPGVQSTAYSPDGSLVATGSSIDVAELWRASDGALVRYFLGHGDVVTDVAFSPDGLLLATASLDRTIRLWRPSTGTLRKIIGGRRHSVAVRSVEFSSDGHLIAAGNVDGTISLRSMPNGRLIRTIGKPGRGAGHIAFSPDDTVIASSRENRLEFWQVSDGELLTSHDVETGKWITSIAFSPDGNHLVYGRNDATVVVIRSPLTGGGDCGPEARLGARCRQGGSKVVGILKRATPRTAVTFTVDGLDPIERVTDDDGRAHVTYKKQSPGRHVLRACDLEAGC